MENHGTQYQQHVQLSNSLFFQVVPCNWKTEGKSRPKKKHVGNISLKPLSRSPPPNNVSPSFLPLKRPAQEKKIKPRLITYPYYRYGLFLLYSKLVLRIKQKQNKKKERYTINIFLSIYGRLFGPFR